MIWFLLALALIFGGPVALAAFGVIASVWLVMTIAGLVWGLVTFAFGKPFLAALIGLAVGVWIGRRQNGAPRVR